MFGLFGSIAHSQTVATAVTPCADCSWSDASTWVGGVVPGCFDEIVIPAGSDINITSTVDISSCAPVDMTIAGSLHFQTGKKLKLPTGSTFTVVVGASVTAGGGGGSSNYIQIGSEEVWNAGQGDITVPITLCEGCSQLAVELISFDLKQNGRKVDLYWVTSSEENNDHFTIERSGSDNNWSQLALIDGNGTTSQTSFYSYQDQPSKDGIYYYRLFQTDHDGTTEFLGELSVNFKSELMVVKRFDLLGKEVTGAPEGLVIELLSDNSSRKVYYGK